MPPNAVKKKNPSVNLSIWHKKKFEEEKKKKVEDIDSKKKERGVLKKKPHTDNAPTKLQDYLLAMQ